MSRPWCAACAFLRDPASRKVACQARDPARARGDLPCPRPDADEPALPGAMFSSFSRLPYVGEPPRALRAAYFSLLAIGGTCQHLNRYFPGSKPHTVSKTVDLTFSIVLAPIIVMLPCTLTKLFQLLPKEKGYTFLGLFFGVALAAPRCSCPRSASQRTLRFPPAFKGTLPSSPNISMVTFPYPSHWLHCSGVLRRLCHNLSCVCRCWQAGRVHLEWRRTTAPLDPCAFAMHPKTLLSRLVVACALARDNSVRCVLVCSAEHVSGSSRTADGLAQGWSVGRRAQQAS